MVYCERKGNAEHGGRQDPRYSFVDAKGIREPKKKDKLTDLSMAISQSLPQYAALIRSDDACTCPIEYLQQPPFLNLWQARYKMVHLFPRSLRSLRPLLRGRSLSPGFNLSISLTCRVALSLRMICLQRFTKASSTFRRALADVS